MDKIRIHRNDNYTTINNSVFFDTTLSYKAKGLLAQMLSIDSNPKWNEVWDWSVSGLVKLSSDGKSSVDSGIKELEEHGYLKRAQMRDAQGHMCGYSYDIYESPFTENPKTDMPTSEKQQQINNIINKDNNNKTTNVVKENIIKEVPVIEVEVVDEYSFDTFWKLYDYKKGKALAEKQWNKLTKQERKLAIEYVPAYVASTPDKSYRKHPSTFINQKGWNDEITDRSHQHQPQSKQQSTSMQDIFARADVAYQSGLFS